MIKRIHRRKPRRTKLLIRRIIVVGIPVFISFIIVFCSILLWKKSHKEQCSAFVKEDRKMTEEDTNKVEQPEIEEALLTPNEYSRPQLPLEEVKGIVIHYTANPGTDAMNNRKYFESLKETHAASASSHFIIGLDGTIVQCIPLDEIAYASNERNADTISIECCHKTEDGEFTDETYQSLIKLTAWLCGEYDLGEEDIIRHYDVTGKICPKYYVEHEDSWKKLKQDVFEYIDIHALEEEDD